MFGESSFCFSITASFCLSGKMFEKTMFCKNNILIFGGKVQSVRLSRGSGVWSGQPPPRAITSPQHGLSLMGREGWKSLKNITITITTTISSLLQEIKSKAFNSPVNTSEDTHLTSPHRGIIQAGREETESEKVERGKHFKNMECLMFYMSSTKSYMFQHVIFISKTHTMESINLISHKKMVEKNIEIRMRPL